MLHVPQSGQRDLGFQDEQHAAKACWYVMIKQMKGVRLTVLYCCAPQVVFICAVSTLRTMLVQCCALVVGKSAEKEQSPRGWSE